MTSTESIQFFKIYIDSCMSIVIFTFLMFQYFLRGHETHLAFMIIMHKDLIFPLHGLESFEHGQKHSLGSLYS
jgi:hypothetical protein